MSTTAIRQERASAQGAPSLAEVSRRLWREAAGARDGRILLIVDALGAETLRRHGDAAPALADAWREGGSAVARAPFPSTTAACLPTLGRGVPPAEHGLMGYSFRDGGGEIVWPTHLEPDHPPLAAPAQAPAPARAALMAPDTLAWSFLSREAFGAVTPARLETGRAAEDAARLLDSHDLVLVYFPDVDAAGHRRGLGSRAHRAALAKADHLYADLLALTGPARIAAIADHGMVPVERWLQLEAFVAPEDVAALAGEARAVHLYAASGRAEPLLRSCESIPGALVMSRRECDDSGLFGGPLPPSFAGRVGDVVVTFDRPGPAIVWRGGPGERLARGQHGGLSDEEVLVPVIQTP